jgi:hypothetical protein
MKLDQAQFYRARADAERAMAEQTRLPHERVRHLRSAEVWDAMAQKAEHSLRLKARNQRAKRRQLMEAPPARSRVNRLTPKG